MARNTSNRPYSRTSSALRRLLAAADSTTPAVSHVYGDADVVTVVYQARGDGSHQEMIGGCVAALTRLDERDLEPDVVRGVCRPEDADVPLVWLLPREWALAYDNDRLDRVDVQSPTVTRPDGNTTLETMTTDSITNHG